MGWLNTRYVMSSCMMRLAGKAVDVNGHLSVYIEYYGEMIFLSR